MKILKRALVVILLTTVAGGIALWEWLDVPEAILGDAHLASIDSDHLFVAWNDFGEEIPNQAHVITDSGQVVSSNLAGRNEVVFVAAAKGKLAYAALTEGLNGSIWIADAPEFRPRRIVGPDAKVNHGTQLVFVSPSRLLWTGFAGGSVTALALTDLTSFQTRELFRLDQLRDVDVLTGGKKVLLVARPPDPNISQPRGLILNVDSGSLEEPLGQDEVVGASANLDNRIYLISKRGRIATLPQCPGDSGPGDNRNLRHGQLSHVRQGRSEIMNIRFDGEPSELAAVPGKRALIVGVTKADREGCPVSNYRYLDLETLEHHRLSIPSSSFFESSLDGSRLALVENDSLRILPLPRGRSRPVNPEGTGTLRSLSWSSDGRLWYVSNMRGPGSGIGLPRVWQRSPQGELTPIFDFLGAPPVRSSRPEALAVVLGVGFLYVFYRAIQLQWPESYFGVTDLSAYSIATSPIRYIAFRFAPVYLTCLFAAVTLDRSGESSFAGALGIGIGHSLLTSGWALIQASRWGKTLRRHRFPILMLRILTLFGLVLVAWLAWRTRSLFVGLVPEASLISATLWTGVVAAVVGVFIVRISRGHSITEYEMAQEGLRRIPPALFKLAQEEAKSHGADPNLVHAVMIVENLQRPPWFRRLENFKGILFKRGTYGIMQVGSPRPLTDEESIRRAVQNRLAGVSVLNDKGYVDKEKLKAFATRYNPNPNFYALLGPAYNEVKNKTLST